MKNGIKKKTKFEKSDTSRKRRPKESRTTTVAKKREIVQKIKDF